MAVHLEVGMPQWGRRDWFNPTLVVDGYYPNMNVHDDNTLNGMMASDMTIKLSVTKLTINTRSMPFAEGAQRTASYARTAFSLTKFVVKS